MGIYWSASVLKFDFIKTRSNNMMAHLKHTFSYNLQLYCLRIYRATLFVIAGGWWLKMVEENSKRKSTQSLKVLFDFHVYFVANWSNSSGKRNAWMRISTFT